MSTTTNDRVQIVRHGNKLALVFDESFLKEAGIDETTEVNAHTDGTTVSLQRSAAVSADFTAAMKRVHAEWSDVFKKLAE